MRTVVVKSLSQIVVTRSLAILLWAMVATGASAQGPGAVTETLEPNQTTDAASLMALIEDFDGITAAFGQQIVDSNNQILNLSLIHI